MWATVRHQALWRPVRNVDFWSVSWKKKDFKHQKHVSSWCHFSGSEWTAQEVSMAVISKLANFIQEKNHRMWITGKMIILTSMNTLDKSKKFKI